MNIQKDYLGDGLYAEYDGYQIRLWTDRGNGNIHEVFLDPDVLADCFGFIEKAYGVMITVTKKLPPTCLTCGKKLEDESSGCDCSL